VSSAPGVPDGESTRTLAEVFHDRENTIVARLRQASFQNAAGQSSGKCLCHKKMCKGGIAL
jgi:hypothetical protein